MSLLTGLAVAGIERGLLPDSLTRAGIRRLLRGRLEGLGAPDLEAFAAEMRAGPVAPVPEKANEQHYEVPAAFFEKVLGPRLKYSSGWWPEGVADLAAAEEAALAETARRAEVADGMEVLDLGCGWGSLTLYLAERFPGSRITGVSNSAGQREFILGRARERGLGNVRVLTADMNAFDSADRFDRVLSVEMFEHMRNWEELLRRISTWLRPGGKLFLHVFCHRTAAYRFEAGGAANWMDRHFFTGGIMPAERLIDRFDRDLRVEARWTWDGTHYARTCEAWLANLDAAREEVLRILAPVTGTKEAARQLRRWRVFFLACAELFAFDSGREWMVAHARLQRS